MEVIGGGREEDGGGVEEEREESRDRFRLDLKKVNLGREILAEIRRKMMLTLEAMLDACARESLGGGGSREGIAKGIVG